MPHPRPALGSAGRLALCVYVGLAAASWPTPTPSGRGRSLAFAEPHPRAEGLAQGSLAEVTSVGDLSLVWARPGQVAPEPPLLEPVAETAHARYYAASGLKVDVRRNEAFLARLFSLFGTPPPGWRLSYFRHGSIAEMRTLVGVAAYGTTELDSLRIDSVREFHPHELVHAVAAGRGRPPLLFAEGLAVALTSEGRWRGRDVDEVARAQIRAHLGLERPLRHFGVEDVDRDYAMAASFVAFLLDREGIDVLLLFFRGCGNSTAGYEEAFRRAYGGSVRSLATEWEKALLRRSRVRRVWYDPRRWPGALRRGEPARAAAIPAAGPYSISDATANAGLGPEVGRW